MQQTKLRHASFFSGLGGCSSALKQAKIPFTTLAISEINQKALRIYKAIHGSVPTNLGDITEIDPSDIPTDIDIWTGGPPCQKFSRLGSRVGFSADLSPMFSFQDLILDCLPAYVLMENVQDILFKSNKEGLDSYLEPLREFYNVEIVKENPHDLGYLQSRTRAWFLLSRHDVPVWKAPKFTSLSQSQTWGDVADRSPKKGSFIEVLHTSQIGKDPNKKNWSIDSTATKFNCFTRGTVDSRCCRGSWIQWNGVHRAPTDNESFRLFGYIKFPKSLIAKTKGVSRTSFYQTMGNSWHVGFASQLFAALPYKKYLDQKFDRWLQSFIKMPAVTRLSKGKIARTVSALESWDDLMTTRSGSPRRITCTTSHKFDMRNGAKIETMGAYLAPSVEAGHGINTCPNSGDCSKMCLITSGQMVTGFAGSSRIAKTRAFYGYPLRFLTQLLREIYKESKKAFKRGDLFQYRTNGTSDIMWERFIDMDKFYSEVDGFEGFYDYTKIGKRRLKNLPSTYHLTFSVDEKPNSFHQAIAYLKAGFSVSVVLHESEKQKALLIDGPIIDGDLSDHRPQDPKGSIVLLRSKGKARKTTSKFVKPASFVSNLVYGLVHISDEIQDA